MKEEPTDACCCQVEGQRAAQSSTAHNQHWGLGQVQLTCGQSTFSHTGVTLHLVKPCIPLGSLSPCTASWGRSSCLLYLMMSSLLSSLLVFRGLKGVTLSYGSCVELWLWKKNILQNHLKYLVVTGANCNAFLTATCHLRWYTHTWLTSW